MLKAIFDFFSPSSGPSNQLEVSKALPEVSKALPEVSKALPEILFDYKKFPVLYLSRCKPVLEQMVDCGLVDKLYRCKLVEDFGCPERFGAYDLSDVIFANPMLKKICESPNQICIDSDEELKQVVKIVMKKYLMELNQPSEQCKSKVSVQVLVPNSRKIQVVSYANENKDNTPRFKDPGGSVEPGETPLQAGIREVEEELGLIVQELELIEQKDNLYKYRLELNETEYTDYIKKVNTLDIDPEITMIAVTEC